MIDTEAPSVRGRTPLRRRYFLATTAILAVVGATLSVSFAADSGTTTASVTGSTSAVGVYDVDGAVPANTWDFNGGGVDAILELPNGSELNESAGTVTWSNADSPGWSVAGGASGTVSTDGAGDLAYLDASGSSSSKILVSVYVTNMAELAVNYTSWAFNIELYQATGANAAGPTPTWGTAVSELVTSDSGTVTFIADISSMDHLALTLASGGSFYAVQTDTVNGDLGPEFFIRSTQL